MVGREDDGVWVTLKETIHAAPAEVAACLSSAGGLCRWLAVACEYGSEPGETVSISWDREWNSSTTVKILDLEPDVAGEGRCRVRWEWFPDILDETPVPVELTSSPLPDVAGASGGVRVILRHGPFPDTADAILTAASSAEEWRWYLCNLRSVLEAKHDMRAVRPL
ncbi:MAG: SRPBCC domain-containing protein [Planctomycetota bacterium]|jgi:hypothetical protein